MTESRTANGLLVSIEGAIATVTLDRPDQRNAIDKALHADLEALWPALAINREVRAIVLTGAGDCFSAGGDLAGMARRAGTAEAQAHALGLPGMARRLLSGMLDVPQPIVAAINGHAVGLGATLALFSDVTVMAEGARIGDSHVDVGLVAGDGGAIVWPLLVGMARAKEMLLGAKLLRGSEAAAMGLVNYALPVGEVLPKARAIAGELAAKPPLALQWTKQVLNRTLKRQLELLLDEGMALEMMSMTSADHKEAVTARVEKREPRFEGR